MLKTKKGVKFDDKKIRMDLLPDDMLEEVAKVLTLGSKIYDDDNWIKVPNAVKRYTGALRRHYKDYWKAQFRGREDLRYDKESGCSHLAHLVCCALFLMWFEQNPDKEVKE